MEELTEVPNPPKKSAPGPDNIPYDFIRYLPDNQKSNLSHIINGICECNISFERHQTITRPTEMRLQETVSELNINLPYAYPIGPNENPPWNSIAPKFHLECNTYRKKDTNRTIFLTLFNTILHTYDRIVPYFKFQDQKLHWREHVDMLATKCEKNMNIMKAVSNISWEMDREILLEMYSTLILSKIDYGRVVYGAAKKSYLKQLDSIQGTGLGLAFGGFRTS
ncbi:hypothetical protein JTB14_028412 [Gonioctena quinquepunctata]|nr:hypothetical protein JTB14_028412 [Gonioctena quinquepunctata]